MNNSLFFDHFDFWSDSICISLLFLVKFDFFLLPYFVLIPDYDISFSLKYQYFKYLLHDTFVTKCETCNKMFHTDDYELQLLQKGHCPFCRAPAPFASNAGSNPAVVGGSGISGVNDTSEMSNNFSLS